MNSFSNLIYDSWGWIILIGASNHLLYELAPLYGIQTIYRDHKGHRRQAGPHSLLAVLQALGAPLTNTNDARDVLRQHKRQVWQRCLQPVAIAWDGKPITLELCLPAQETKTIAACRLELENGQVWRWFQCLHRLPLLQTITIDGVSYERRQFAIHANLPFGYHYFYLELLSRQHEVLIISAPGQAYALPKKIKNRLWGCFIPLYALHSQQSWGSGDLGDLGSLLSWLHKLGGNLVGTLPLLSAFLDQPFSPSPFEPVSRLFWNEFYLDISRIEEFKKNKEAQELFFSVPFQKELAALQKAPLVDYRQGMALKRKILKICAHAFFNNPDNHERQTTLHRWLTANPEATDYARFRAAMEQKGRCWPQWPTRMASGNLRPDDYDPQAMQYHLYVQWQMQEQLQQLSRQAKQNKQRLYLDLPLGVHPCGYDTWRYSNIFAPKVSCGAPPDSFFSQGQNWGLTPLHPQRIRQEGYRYFIRCLRHQLQYAGIMRLDHVAGLHRLYWIPEGMTAKEGIYVHYHAKEFYAILTLESQRYQALLVGEDLGTVPAYIRKAMEKHKLSRMYVLPFAQTKNPQQPLQQDEGNALACLNTHDMPPFASFWLQKKPSQRAVLSVHLYQKGFLKVATSETQKVCHACLALLAASPAPILLINLEDLWLEEKPQNIPGTTLASHPNWQRKLYHTLEEIIRKPQIEKTLKRMNCLRTGYPS